MPQAGALSDNDIAAVKSAATTGSFTTEGGGDTLVIGGGFMGVQRIKTATASATAVRGRPA